MTFVPLCGKVDYFSINRYDISTLTISFIHGARARFRVRDRNRQSLTCTISSLSRVIQVSLISSDPGYAQETGIAPKPQLKQDRASSPVPELLVEHQNTVPEFTPTDIGPASLLTTETVGVENSAGNTEGVGGQVTASMGTGIGGDPGFGIIPPEQWSLIVSAIERTKNYPRLARERGIEGEVRLRFKINAEGAVEKIEILESSGSDILDNASVRAVYRAVPLPAVSGWIEIPMKYVLK